MEFGCGSGERGHSFKRIASFCRYIGVEKNVVLAQEASAHLDEAVTADAADVSFEEGDEVDCLVYHSGFLSSSESQRMLREHATHVSCGGAVVFFVENPAYFRRVLSLWRGMDLPPAYWTASEAVEQLTKAELFVERVLPVGDEEDDAFFS